MEERKTDWQLHIFGNTTHAFTNPEANTPDKGMSYQKDSSRRAFVYMEQFFREVF